MEINKGKDMYKSPLFPSNISAKLSRNILVTPVVESAFEPRMFLKQATNKIVSSCFVNTMSF